MDGLIKCSIAPPERFNLPVLRLGANQKLMICLCRTCSLTSNNDKFLHTTDEERYLTGSLVIDEVRLGVQNVYRI